MTSPRKPSFILPVAVALAALLGLYVGAYCWMVKPFDSAEDGLTAIYVDDFRLSPSSWSSSLVCDRFFAPILWFDRRVRPHVWEPKP